MQAVIMAGGKGTRLSSVIKNVPKPMVQIDGKPLLEYQIRNLKENGVDNIILVVGYLGDVIKNYFGDGSHFGVDISYYTERAPLGTAGALGEIKNRVEDDFYLVFGDLFINIDFKRFYQFHIKKQAAITLFVHPNSHPYDSDIVITNDENRVIEWSCKNTERAKDFNNLVNAGVYIVNRKICNYVFEVQHDREIQKLDLEKDVIIKLITNRNTYAYHSTEYVKDIGTPERLGKVKMDFQNGVCECRNLKNKQKCIFLDRDGTINKYVGLLTSVNQMELEPNAANAVRLINESEYLCVVVTNQPVIARGSVTFEELDAIHKHMYMLLGKEGAYVDGLYFCPHHPDSGYEGEVKGLKVDCDCRKPKIGLLKKAEVEFNIDLENSWFIGDTNMDVQTGINAGMHTCLLKSGDPDKNSKYQVKPEIIAIDLFDAVKHILVKEKVN